MADTYKKYTYNFGIDSIIFSKSKLEQNQCFITDEVKLENQNKKKYIQLDAEFSCDTDSSIEFYIIDGSVEKSILPINTSRIIDEKIFYGLRPRFSIDSDEEIVIKKNGTIVDVTLDHAINTNEDGYTVSYTPLNAYNLSLNNDNIKLKIIMRIYNTDATMPIIKKMSIRQFGGDSTWSNNIIN